MTSATLMFIPCFSGAPWALDQLAPLSDRSMRTMRLTEGVSDIERYADDVVAAISDLSDYVLVGDSFGANIALAVAVRQPAGLRALVLSGGFAANPVDSAPWRTAMRLMGRVRGRLYRQVVLRVHAHRLASPHDHEGQMAWTKADSRRLFLDNTPAATFGARVTAALEADYTQQLGNVAVPTLILTPSHDVLIGENAAAVLREGIPGAREVTLPRTGHMFRFSHPHTYAQAVAGFLTDVLGKQEETDSATS